jgi:hypothetical protein
VPTSGSRRRSIPNPRLSRMLNAHIHSTGTWSGWSVRSSLRSLNANTLGEPGRSKSQRQSVPLNGLGAAMFQRVARDGRPRQHRAALGDLRKYDEPGVGISSDQPPILRITGRCLPDRGTIGGSDADRDYRMSRHDNAALTLVAPPRIADRRPFLATRPRFSLALRNPVDGFLSFAQEVPPPPATTFPRRLHVIFTRAPLIYFPS